MDMNAGLTLVSAYCLPSLSSVAIQLQSEARAVSSGGGGGRAAGEGSARGEQGCEFVG